MSYRCSQTYLSHQVQSSFFVYLYTFLREEAWCSKGKKKKKIEHRILRNQDLDSVLLPSHLQTILIVLTYFISFLLLLVLYFNCRMWIPQDFNISIWKTFLFHGLWDCLPLWCASVWQFLHSLGLLHGTIEHMLEVFLLEILFFHSNRAFVSPLFYFFSENFHFFAEPF